MSEKIVIKQKIVFKNKEERTLPLPVIEAQKPENIKPNKPSETKKKGLKSHIKKYFCKPLSQLIENDGVNDGELIANPDALRVLDAILNSILERKKITIIEILESFAFEDVEDENQEESIEDEQDEEDLQDEEEQSIEEDQDEVAVELEEEEEEEEQEEEEEDQFDYEDLQEARECDSYVGYEKDESMDG